MDKLDLQIHMHVCATLLQEGMACVPQVMSSTECRFRLRKRYLLLCLSFVGQVAHETPVQCSIFAGPSSREQYTKYDI